MNKKHTDAKDGPLNFKCKCDLCATSVAVLIHLRDNAATTNATMMSVLVIAQEIDKPVHIVQDAIDFLYSLGFIGKVAP